MPLMKNNALMHMRLSVIVKHNIKSTYDNQGALIKAPCDNTDKTWLQNYNNLPRINTAFVFKPPCTW